MLILSSIFRWRAQDYDYHGNCARAGDTMRRHLGEHLRRIPLQILYRQRSGELNALLAGTIDETYNHTLIVSNMLIAAVFTPLATALITLIWDWRLGLILLISFPLIVPIQHWTQPLMARAKARLARANASLNAELLEYSQGLPVLKAAKRRYPPVAPATSHWRGRDHPARRADSRLRPRATGRIRRPRQPYRAKRPLRPPVASRRSRPVLAHR
ncbi:ABC transporter transmembrane domain-containing protein, partial [Eikenella corrodens]|uniref:ABC transporter transmembrane domain-containing protein n=1 Tax=Eikenella corrodens TaxID=539 RepID=UPI0028E73A36